MHVETVEQKLEPVKPTSIGKVAAEYITHKEVALSLGVISEQQFQHTCASVHRALQFANGSDAAISTINGALWKDYDAWRRSCGLMDADLLNDEHAAISALFEFAEQQNYTASENRPCFRKRASETSELIRWVKQQDVQWAAFTLKFPRFHNRMVWERALTDFFWELENRYPKSSIKKHRKKSGVPVLHRIAFMGGDKAAGIALHAQGMVEIQERGIERLGEEMEGIWRSVVKRHSDSFCRDEHERHNEPAWLLDAKVWLKEWQSDDDSAAAYLVYLARNEQFDFGIGASKVVLSATSLKPIRS